MDNGVVLGADLAHRHSGDRPPRLDREASLLNHAEVLRSGEWSLRSSLTRLAQPEPVRAALVLDLMRRCGYPLSNLQRDFEAMPVICDWRLSVDDGGLTEARQQYPDGRAADLARVIRARPHLADACVAGYESVASELSEGERHALPLLVGILALDELAEALAAWASQGHANPPVQAIDVTCRRLEEYLEVVGVAHEPGPP